MAIRMAVSGYGTSIPLALPRALEAHYALERAHGRNSRSTLIWALVATAGS